MKARSKLPLLPLLPMLLAAGCQEGGLREVNRTHAALTVCADGETVDGIDVSHWQGTIDWDTVATSGVEYAFIRVSDGTSVEDSQFDRNWSEARRVGIVRGAYQFFRPGADPVAQADLLLERMGTLEPGDLPPVIDVETADGQPPGVVGSRIRTWLDRVEDATGMRPIIYTGKYIWQSAVDGDFSDYPLWIAQYGPECPDLPTGWSEWAFFQTSSTGSVPGISGNVDLDLFNGDLDALRDFAGPCDGCPVCEPVPAGGRVVDESERCFRRGGDPDYWRTEEAGWDDSLLWTHTTDAPDVDNHGVWELTLDEAGLYRVEAYTDPAFAQSTAAGYEIVHDSITDRALVDQSATDGWNLVGEYHFGAGGDQWVRLDDNTGEPYASRTRIAFDAIRLTRIDGPDADGGVPGDGGAPTADGGTAADGGPVPDRSDGGFPAADGGPGGDDPATGTASGCSCRVGVGGGEPRAPLSVLVALLPAAAVLRRVRRRRRDGRDGSR